LRFDQRSVATHAILRALLRITELTSSMTPTVNTDPITQLRVRLSLLLLPFTSLILAISWWNLRGAPNVTLNDLYGLPALSLFSLVLAVLLALDHQRLETIQRVVLSLVALFLLLDLATSLLPEVRRTGQLGPGTPWFPVIAIMAFFTFSQRDALRFGWVYLGLALAIGLWFFRGGVDAQQFSSLLHFYAGNTTVIGLLWALGRLRVEYATMQHFAHTDALTGLTNRRSMQAQLERLVHSRRVFTVFMVDVDRFKTINDSKGHAFGDQVLRELALAFAGHVRNKDRIARWGGEEFLVLMSDLHAERAITIGERLLEIARNTRPGGLHVTVSIGMAHHHPGSTLEDTLARADSALYRAKHAGRDRLEGLPAQLN
jgi:diguanylate cyclase (GGDEF)-like protein